MPVQGVRKPLYGGTVHIDPTPGHRFDCIDAGASNEPAATQMVSFNPLPKTLPSVHHHCENLGLLQQVPGHAAE